MRSDNLVLGLRVLEDRMPLSKASRSPHKLVVRIAVIGLVLALAVSLWLALRTTAAPGLAPGPTPTVDPALLQNAQAMAQSLGISVTEAEARLQDQGAVGNLGASLEQAEEATFAGLWIQQTPEYRVVVAFTRDGQQTIRRYVAGTPLESVIEVRTAAVTLAELKADQAQAHALVAALGMTLGLTVDSSINIQGNQVELYITDRPRFDAALAAAGARLPAHVVVISTYEPLGTPSFPLTPDASLRLPQLASRSPAFMEALLEGTLVEQDNCLRVTGAAGYSILIIWQPDYFVNNRDGVVEVLNRDGALVAQVGQTVRMGGGEVPSTCFEGDLREPLPAGCAGPYWLMGDIETLAAQAVADVDVYPVLASGSGNPGLFLAQSRPAPDTGVLTGTLTLDEQGCLRVRSDPSAAGYTILWPPGIYPRDDPPPAHFVQIIGGVEEHLHDVEQTVAVLGQAVRLRGSQRAPDDYRYFANKVACSGPYWGVAKIEAVP
jgi:hypothetical protein